MIQFDEFTRISEDYSNVYEGLAAQFNEETGLDDGTTPATLSGVDADRFHELMYELEWRRRFSALQEEVGEVEDAINDGDFTEAEKELTDVIVTAFTLADTFGIDIQERYCNKMDHNLQKSSSVSSTGKVTDDV